MRRAGRRPAAGEGTRQALLRAGTELFAERGFDGATAELIARRAGANKAMINYHFRSKKGLYEAILVATFTELAARMEGVRAAGGPAPEQLRQFIGAFARRAEEHPAFPAMLLREVLSGGEHLSREAFGRLLAVATVVRGIVEEGVREGRFRPVDPLMTHLSVVGSLCFFFATSSFRRRALAEFRLPVPPPTVAGFVAHMQEMVTRGLAAEPAARAGRAGADKATTRRSR